MKGFWITLPAIFLSALLAPWPAHAGVARCFMHGIMTPKLENREKTSLSDMIRLHFDVSSPDDKAKCEQMMESYCVNNVKGKDYAAGRLKGSFKPDVDKSDETTYHFTDNCKLQAD